MEITKTREEAARLKALKAKAIENCAVHSRDFSHELTARNDQ